MPAPAAAPNSVEGPLPWNNNPPMTAPASAPAVGFGLDVHRECRVQLPRVTEAACQPVRQCRFTVRQRVVANCYWITGASVVTAAPYQAWLVWLTSVATPVVGSIKMNAPPFVKP